MNPIEVGDLRNAVIHTLKKPFIRVKGIDLDFSNQSNKKGIQKQVKVISGGLQRKLQVSKYMEVSNELTNVIGTLIDKGNVKQFWNSFYNARPPFDDMWLEFDRCEAIRPFADEKTLSLMNKYKMSSAMGVWIHRTDARDFLRMGGLSESLTAMGKDFEGCYYTYNFFACETFERDGERVTEKINHYPYGIMSSAFCSQNFSGIEEHESGPNHAYLDKFLGGYWDTEGERSLENNLFGSGVFSEEYQNIKNNLMVTNSSIHLNPVWEANLDEHNLMRDIAGTMPMVTAILSMLNYPWTTQENYSPHNNVKSITNKMTPYDSHIRVSINLPKEKVINLTMKQKARTRPFGVREHDVMGHRRTWIDKHGERRETWVKSHTRGDSKLGRVYKDYVLDKDGKKRVANSR